MSEPVFDWRSMRTNSDDEYPPVIITNEILRKTFEQLLPSLSPLERDRLHMLMLKIIVIHRIEELTQAASDDIDNYIDPEGQ